MNKREQLDSLYEELYQLDEIAAEQGDEANRRVEQRRREIRAEMRKLESALRFHSRYA